jgi:diguanylate cyclase (GGDEF)-like protein
VIPAAPPLPQTAGFRARLDPLTRLPNRVGLRGAFESTGDDETTTALAILELNCLEEVNERHGCWEGDRLLRYFSDRLSRNLPGSTAGRWGGNAFLVIFPGSTSERASLTLAEALAPLVREPFQTLAQTPVKLSVATGLTEVRFEGSRALDDLVSELPLVTQ